MKTASFISVLIMLLCCSQGSLAHSAPPADTLDPAQSIQHTLDKISAFRASPLAQDPQALRDFIEHEIMPHFGFEAMSQAIAGPFAHHMSAADKADFIAQLKINFLGILIAHLARFDPVISPVQIYKTRYGKNNEASVALRIAFRQRRALNLNFRMRLVDHRWKVIDIRSNGTSLVLYYRAHYINQLRGFRDQARLPRSAIPASGY